MTFTDPNQLTQALDDVGYLVDRGLATALFLAQGLGQPLLLEGEPGVGKTTAAQAMAQALGAKLIRLQCYEGISAAEALYEWNYARQLLEVRLAESGDESVGASDLFTEQFLLDRPLLQALRHGGPEPAVLLIDELDRSDAEFEALLFEFLGERSVTVPELGTFRAVVDPVVLLTSNRSRELHDALKRRCLYHWIAFPEIDQATEIVRRNVPSAARPLIATSTQFVSRVRSLGLDKSPGIAETIDWVGALHMLGVSKLDSISAAIALSAIVKTPDDLEVVTRGIDEGSLLVDLEPGPTG